MVPDGEGKGNVLGSENSPSLNVRSIEGESTVGILEEDGRSSSNLSNETVVVCLNIDMEVLASTVDERIFGKLVEVDGGVVGLILLEVVVWSHH